MAKAKELVIKFVRTHGDQKAGIAAARAIIEEKFGTGKKLEQLDHAERTTLCAALEQQLLATV